MDVFKPAVAFFKFFLPPKVNAPEDQQLKWRYKVAITLATLTSSLGIVGALALGTVPSITGGVALKSEEQKIHAEMTTNIQHNSQEIETIREGLSQMRADQLDTRLHDTRGRQCSAMIMKNQAAKRSEGDRLDEDLPKFRALTGMNWRIPPCDEY